MAKEHYVPLLFFKNANSLNFSMKKEIKESK